MSATIKDIAAAADVSTATVSRTINNPEKVKKATREKIESLVRELEYRPNYLARSLKKRRTDSVGILASFSMNTYLSEILEAVELVLIKNGIFSYVCNCEFDLDLEKKYARALIGRNIDALIVIEAASFNRPDNYFITHTFDFPVILINQHTRPYGSAYVARVDQAPGIMEALDYVFARNLFPFLLFLGTDTYSFRLKEELFTAWKKEHNIPDRDAGIYWPQGGISSNDESIIWYTYGNMAKEILRSPSRPRFIFAGNDLIAMGVLAAAKELDIGVPDELAVVGVDNTLFSRISFPPLSTVDLRMREVGALAAELYLRIRNRDPDIPRVQTIPSRFHERRSTPPAVQSETAP
jgi:DNA-binding LacI/PurR family transcriptional regulator